MIEMQLPWGRERWFGFVVHLLEVQDGQSNAQGTFYTALCNF